MGATHGKETETNLNDSKVLLGIKERGKKRERDTIKNKEKERTNDRERGMEGNSWSGQLTDFQSQLFVHSKLITDKTKQKQKLTSNYLWQLESVSVLKISN